MTSELEPSPQPTTEVKRKRGRPTSVMSIELYATYVHDFEEITTRRGRLNKYYETHGFGVLLAMKKKGITGIDFLLDPKQIRIIRSGILRELGRITDQELAEKVALTICECEKQRHRTVREYERLMRVCRLKGLTDYLIVIIRETVSLNQTVSENKDNVSDQ